MIIELVGGFSLGVVALLAARKQLQLHEKEKIDRLARSLVTTYGNQALRILNRDDYWLTGYLHSHPMHHKIVTRIPEMQRIMEEEEKIRKEISAL